MELNQSIPQDLKYLLPNKPAAAENSSNYFNCSICLDCAQEAVVTLCGHLYCWPCIYKWLHLQTDQHPQCPVCKAYTPYTAMIPVYGLGQSSNSDDDHLRTDEARFRSTKVPPRPPPCLSSTAAAQSRHQLHRQHNLPSSHLVSSTTGHSSMFGDVFHTLVFGNAESFSAHPNSYHLPRPTTLRLRRFYRQADKSLHRISIFLFCCLLLCLIVF